MVSESSDNKTDAVEKLQTRTLLKGQFKFRDANTVVCIYCNDEFKYHRSTSTLAYHLRAKHAFKPTTSSTSHQVTMAEMLEKAKPMDQKKV